MFCHLQICHIPAGLAVGLMKLFFSKVKIEFNFLFKAERIFLKKPLTFRFFDAILMKLKREEGCPPSPWHLRDLGYNTDIFLWCDEHRRCVVWRIEILCSFFYAYATAD